MDVIVNFAPTGAVPSKRDTEHVPVSVQEIVEEVISAAEIGISTVHLHAREEGTGAPTYKASIYERIISGIRKYLPDLVICVSLSGRHWSDFERRTEVLDLDGNVKPDMGSLTLGSLNFVRDSSINSPEHIQRIAKKLAEKRILPELEVFDLGMLNYAKYLEKKGLITPPYLFNIVLGNIASAQASISHVGMLLHDLPANSVCCLGGIGSSQLPMNALAVTFDYGVRVGLEDNIWYDKKKGILASNIDLLKRVNRLMQAQDKKVLEAKALRKILQLEVGNGAYGRSS